MALEFKKVAKPVIKRTVNEFIEPVGLLEPGSEEALTVVLPLKNEADRKALNVALRLLTEAGNEQDEPVTVRRNIVEEKAGTEKGEAIVTFWTVPKIKHGDSVDEIKEQLKTEVQHEVEAQLSKN